VSAAIAQADISTKVSAAIAQADISTKVSAAIAQADISTKVSAAIAQADISTKVSAAIAQEDIPKKVNDAIEPAKREVEEAAASAKTAAATTKAAAAAMHTFTSYRDAIVAYTEAQKIAEEIQQLTDRAVKDAGEAQSKLSATAAENAKVAVTHVQALNNQSKTELDRAKKLLAFAKIKVDDTNNEENSTNVEGNKSAKESAQKALNEIRVIAGIPSKDGFNIDIDDPALKDYKELFQRVEFKDLPTLKTEVETHAKATQEGLDTVKVTPVSSDPENLQPLMELFLDQKATSANTASASAEPQSDDYADGLMYYFELKNSASPVADSTPEKTGNAKQKSTPAG
jgi:negative regulator of sigma E activity